MFSPAKTILENLDLINECFALSETSPTGIVWAETAKVANRFKGRPAGSRNNKTGYCQVRLPKSYNTECKNSFTYTHRIAIILRDQKLIEPGFVVDHIDEDNLNNHYSNLQILTQRENIIKARA